MDYIPCSRIEQINVRHLFSKVAYRFTEMLFRIVKHLFPMKLNKLFLKLIWKFKESRITKSILKTIAE